jgi:hypothetical protein
MNAASAKQLNDDSNQSRKWSFGKIRWGQLCGCLRRLADARIFVDRVIHEKLEVVLIGMTVLKKFKVTQFNGKMSIESP